MRLSTVQKHEGQISNFYFLISAFCERLPFSKHGQVKGYFNRELIKTMILPKELGQLYNKAFEYRQKFD